MKANEFVQRLCAAINKRVGFELVVRVNREEEERGFEGRSVEWSHARRSMTEVFHALEREYKLTAGVVPPDEHGSTFRICAQKLCAAAAAAANYAPEFPGLTAWQTDERLQKMLGFCLKNFIMKMVFYSAGAETSDSPFQRVDGPGTSSVETEVISLEEMLHRVVRGEGEEIYKVLDTSRRAVRVVAHLLRSPDVLYALADGARALSTEQDQQEFLREAIGILSEEDGNPNAEKILEIVHRAKVGKKGQILN